MVKDEPKLKEDERWCFKCKSVIKKHKFNSYYDICHACVDGSKPCTR